MTQGSLAAALEREHREIDGGIEEFMAGLTQGKPDPEPLLRALAGLRRHIYLEERFLFPPLRQGGMMMPIMVMLREHGNLWRQMDALDSLIERQAPDTKVQSACTELLAQLEKHNEKEEPIIYPSADGGLSEWEAGQLTEFIAKGRMPEGWVCDGARTP